MTCNNFHEQEYKYNNEKYSFWGFNLSKKNLIMSFDEIIAHYMTKTVFKSMKSCILDCLLLKLEL